jgi:hypothetical protein
MRFLAVNCLKLTYTGWTCNTVDPLVAAKNPEIGTVRRGSVVKTVNDVGPKGSVANEVATRWGIAESVSY